MNDVLWWSGVAFWIVLSALGLPLLFDLFMERIVGGMGLRKEFLAFFVARLKSRRPTPGDAA